MIIRKLLIAAVLVLLSTLSVNAHPITYEYIGPALPGATGVSDGVTGIIGSFTVDLPASNPDQLMNFPLRFSSLTDRVSVFETASTD